MFLLLLFKILVQKVLAFVFTIDMPCSDNSDMPSTPHYQYRNLSGIDCFRLLHLIPGATSIELQFIMKEVSLNDLTESEYIAMSYTWGSPDDKVPIRCGSNGQTVMIPRNLYSALLCLATEPLQGSFDTDDPFGYSVWIWADAICIDQSNLAERSQQVQLMRQIYQSAFIVLVWLGPRENTDQGLIKLIDGLHKNLSEATKGRDPHSLDIVALRDAGQIPPAASEDWVRLGDFYQESWFTRKWVIQEVASAKEIGLMKGPLIIPWDPLWQLPELLIKTNLISLVKSAQLENARLRNVESEWKLNGLQQAYFMSVQRLNLWQKTPLTLFELLCRFRDSLTTEEKDHIFALVGISSDGNHPAYRPDYTREVKEIYTSFAWTSINQYSSLQILSAAGLQGGISNLPSWTPDWTVSPQVIAYGITFPTAFQASGMTNALITHQEGAIAQTLHYQTLFAMLKALYQTLFAMLKALVMHPSCPVNVPTPGYACLTYGGSILTVLGKIVDVIENLGTAHTTAEVVPQLNRQSAIPDWVTSGWTAEQLQTRWSEFTFGEHLHAEAEALAKQQRAYPDYIAGGRMTDAFWRTLICNTTTTGERVPRSYHDNYSSWRTVVRMMQNPEDTFHSTMGEHFARARVYDENFGLAIAGRRFFATQEGYIGLAPSRTVAGDLVCILKGANVPFVLRRAGESFVLVGECYCHGIMYGEAMLREDLKIREISLA